MIDGTRNSKYDLNPAILNRWSPRSMTGEKISHDEVLSLFEAARWAPSSYNNQPWRFIYANKESQHWNTLFNLMIEFNQSWAKNASVLVVIMSSKNFEYNGNPSRTHSFDTGAAWENLAIEATSRGLVTHAMEGFDYEKTRKDLEIPDDYEVNAMIAIGKEGEKEQLSKELQEKEFPSDRKPLSEIMMEGKFRK